MVTAESVHEDLLKINVNEDDFPEFKTAFEPEVRRELVFEDLEAGKNVSGVLVTIVSVGLALMIGSVLLIL